MVVVTAALLATASCGTAAQGPVSEQTQAAAATSDAATRAPSTGCNEFNLSLVSDRGGQPSPVAAGEWFTEHGGVPGLPQSGWHQDGQDERGAVVRSSQWTLHVIRGEDETWQVVSGSKCS
jgi:hypothetical protein